GKVDFTLFFRHLTQLAEGGSPDMASLFSAQTLWPEVAGRIKNRWAAQGGADLEKMRRANPIYIPRNHRVEQAIEAANMGDFAPFETLVSLLERPFEEQNQVHFEAPAKPEEVVHQTFCGT
ncbi:MAG TPA: hypothetical protein VLA51_12250, partial [Paracoccaceae bacterium]|nr:hypothetical protein [Paracoccaceae bacterium]